MNINKYTEKAQEAVIAAQQLAEQLNHAQIEPEHLLLALVEQQDGIVPELLRKLDADPKPFAAALRDDLSRQPQAYGGSHRFETRQNDKGGFSVILEIPFETGESVS